MNYRQKIEIELNDLQKEFFRLFRKTFPEMLEKIVVEKDVIYTHFSFSIESPSEIFGGLQFGIDDTEITVYSEFGHRHFPTYHFGNENNVHRKIQLTCISALEYIKDFVCGNIIVEYEQQGDRILKSFDYHKDCSQLPTSAMIILKDEEKKKSIIAKIKEFFSQPKEQPIVIKKVNWFGEVK